MATNFPSSLDTATQQPSPSSSTEMDASGYEHHTVHTNHSGALIALETKIGTGTSNAASASDGHVLTADGSGGSAWEAASGGSLPTGLTFSMTAGLRVAPDDIASNISSSYPYEAIVCVGQATNGAPDIGFMDSAGTNHGHIGFQGGKALRINNNIGSGGYTYINTNQWIALKSFGYLRDSDLRGASDDAQDLGTSSIRWQDVYSAGGVTTSSDVNLKENVKDTTLGLDFINDLRPVEFKWKNGSRKHQGFIAQEVKTVLDDKDSSADQGMWGLNTVKHPKETIVHRDDDHPDGATEEIIDTVPRQSLRYHELIGPLVKAVQELKTQNDALAARIATLEG